MWSAFEMEWKEASFESVAGEAADVCAVF